MNSKLYRKLYLYAIIIMVASIVLTISIVNSTFNFREKRLFHSHFVKEALFIQRLLRQIERSNPTAMKKNIIDLSKSFHWNVSYIKDGKVIYSVRPIPKMPSKERFDELAKTKQILLIDESVPAEFLYYLDPQIPEKGYLIIKFAFFGRDRQNDVPQRFITPLVTGLLILTFLALLLIPYTLYIVKPFKNLMESINKVSKGDFNATIDVKKNSEFKELAETFNNMTFKINEMIEQKQRLIADVSHELRSPLTRMRLGLEILSKDPEGRRKYIDKSINEIEQLDQMIENILVSSKLELNDKNVKLLDMDLKSVVIENIEKHQLLFEQHHLNINTNFTDEDTIVKLEKSFFDRALNNIFSNTSKYSPENSTVDITINKIQNKVILTIRDRGTGVDKSELEKIFEPFYRTDDSRTRKTGGTGLGLSIVKKIIEVHGGNIYAKLPEDETNGLLIVIELLTV